MTDVPKKIWVTASVAIQHWMDIPSLNRAPRFEYTLTDIPQARIAELERQHTLDVIDAVNDQARIAELEATMKKDAKIYYDAKAIIDAHQVIYREAREEQRVRIAELEAVVDWYGEQVYLYANGTTEKAAEADVALDQDGGKRARETLKETS
jgi:hypothetical protein